MSRNISIRFLFAVLVTFSIVASANAQANRQVFQIKFFCGFSDGRVPKINDPSPLPAPYRAVEPGNYGTVINFQTATFLNQNTITSGAIYANGFPRANLPNVGLMTPFRMVSVDCTDITAALAAQSGFTNDGRFVEGFVVFNHQLFPTDVLVWDFTAGYSYALHKADNTGIGLGSSFQVVHIEPKNLTQPE